MFLTVIYILLSFTYYCYMLNIVNNFPSIVGEESKCIAVCSQIFCPPTVGKEKCLGLAKQSSNKENTLFLLVACIW